MTQLIRIAAVQLDVEFAHRKANLARIESVLEETVAAGAALTVFPECCVTGYCYESRDEALAAAEEIPGSTTKRLAALCRRLDTHMVVGLIEVEGHRLFNACVLLGPEGVAGRYRKIHLPSLGVDRFVAPGDHPFAVHEAAGMRVGMNICYDGGFPESSRVLSLLGADLIVLPTNWPPGAECMVQHAVNARAMENHVYYLAANRIGAERGFRFIGHSKICAPDGSVLAEAAHQDPAILYADVDVELARDKRLVRVPNQHEIDRFADRRPEMYGPIVSPTAEPENL